MSKGGKMEAAQMQRNGTEERRRGDEKPANEASWGEGDEKIWGKKKGHMSEIGHKCKE